MIIIDCKTPQYGTLGLLIHRRVPSRPVPSRLPSPFGALRSVRSTLKSSLPPHCRLVWDTIYILGSTDSAHGNSAVAAASHE